MSILKRFYTVLKRVSDIVEKGLMLLSALLVFACFLAVFFQVINRYVLVKQTLFHWTSISWTDELARFLLVAISFLTLGQIYKHGQMSRADMIFAHLRPIPKKLLYIVEFVMIGIYIVAACKYGIQFALANSIYKSELLRIPGQMLYMIPVIGHILVGYEVFTECIGVLAGEVEPFDCVAPDGPANAE